VLAKSWPFLRPLCGSEEHFKNHKLSLEQGKPVVRRTTITINLHPIILSFTDPAHLALTPPRTFHQSICCQFTHLSARPLPSTHLHAQASAPSIFLSFLPSTPIHPHCQHSISLVRLSCKDEWQCLSPGLCCFINMTDSSGPTVWPLQWQNMR